MTQTQRLDQISKPVFHWIEGIGARPVPCPKCREYSYRKMHVPEKVGYTHWCYRCGHKKFLAHAAPPPPAEGTILGFLSRSGQELSDDDALEFRQLLRALKPVIGVHHCAASPADSQVNGLAHLEKCKTYAHPPAGMPRWSMEVDVLYPPGEDLAFWESCELFVASRDCPNALLQTAYAFEKEVIFLG